MEKLLPVLATLFSLHAVWSHKGLLCTNDYLSSVDCSWNGSALDLSLDCRISGFKKVYFSGKPKLITQSCRLKVRENSLPGCGFVFENREFHDVEKMPNISITCNDTLVETIPNYRPVMHIKMHPPSPPLVRSTENGTWIYWSQGRAVSNYLKFEFQVHLKKKGETWERANLLYSHQQDRSIPVEELKGDLQLRLRVRPFNKKKSQWSEWSPTTSWTGPSDKVEPPGDEEWWLRQIATLSVSLLLPLCLIICVLPLIYRSCKTRGLLREKPIPNPSEYLTVHDGNLKDLLNPLGVSASFFTSQPCEQISQVEVCEDRDTLPSSPPPSDTTSVLLHHRSRPSGSSQTSGVADDSSSSSCFSNMGYFMSSSSGGSARTDSKMAYFTYQDDSCARQPFVFPSHDSWRPYESLKIEQHSPDSGFCTGKEDQLDFDLDEENEDLDDLSSHLLTLPLHLPLQMWPLTRPPGPPHPVSVAPVSSDIRQEEVPATAAGGGSAARVVPGAACRPSSMPVEPNRSGYLTLTELQMTFSNQSI